MPIRKSLKLMFCRLSQQRSMSLSPSMSFILSQSRMHSTSLQPCANSKNQQKTSSSLKKMSRFILLLTSFGPLRQTAPGKRNSMTMTSRIMSFLAVPSRLAANTKARPQCGRNKVNSPRLFPLENTLIQMTSTLAHSATLISSALSALSPNPRQTSRGSSRIRSPTATASTWLDCSSTQYGDTSLCKDRCHTSTMNMLALSVILILNSNSLLLWSRRLMQRPLEDIIVSLMFSRESTIFVIWLARLLRSIQCTYAFM